MKNMTAVMCQFLKAYYTKNQGRIFSDDFADRLFTDEEINGIAKSLISGVSFFAPVFLGNDEEKLAKSVSFLISDVIMRSAYFESILKNEFLQGTSQIVLFGSGYDTLSFKKSLSPLNLRNRPPRNH